MDMSTLYPAVTGWRRKELARESTQKVGGACMRARWLCHVLVISY